MTETSAGQWGAHDLTTGTTAIVREIQVTALPPDDDEAHRWSTWVIRRDAAGWVVADWPAAASGRNVLNRDGEWEREARTSARDDDFAARTRYPLPEALGLAREAATRIKINGYTVPEARQMSERRAARRANPTGENQ